MGFPHDSVLPQGSLILVTGVTGFLAGIITDQLLQHGFRRYFGRLGKGEMDNQGLLWYADNGGSRRPGHGTGSGEQQGFLGEASHGWNFTACD